MDETEQKTAERPRAAPAVIVTGLSGAGRTTAINALEDLGYEALNNFPLSMVGALIEPGSPKDRPIAIGVESRTRGFSVRALSDAVDLLKARWSAGTLLLFLDCEDAALISRFNQTRRRHPLAPAEDAATGIARERDVLSGIRSRADTVIDTSEMSPHDLKKEIETRFGLAGSQGLIISVHSFSYKRGAPDGADMVLDCRFLQNPYWETALRELDGRDPRIQGFVEADPRFGEFFDLLCRMVLTLIPAYRDEGKAYLSVALGCSGGRHRSVTVAEKLARAVSEAGWTTSLRHRELERREDKV